ncbi:MAG: DUF2846 domain-containing protein [Mariprofundaceae bacterium]
MSRYEDSARSFKVPEGRSLLYLYREGIGGIVGHDQVSIDGKRTVEVSDDGYFVIELSPGLHTIEHNWVALGVQLGTKHAQNIQMEAGKWYWLNFWSLDTLGRNTESFGQAVSDINSLDFIDYYIMTSSHESVAELHARKSKPKSNGMKQSATVKRGKIARAHPRLSKTSRHQVPVATGHDSETDFRRALASAIQDDAGAQYRVGKMYHKGMGVEKNAANAVHWYRLAAEQGNAQAQVRLGYMLRFADGVAQNNGEAFKWYYLASKQENSEAHFYLGLMYDTGMGVRRNNVEAMGLYRKSAEHGFALAQLYLGGIYSHGVAVVRDDAEAVKWYRKAASQNVALAQFKIGEMYEEGRGVTKNAAAATDWFYKAGLNYLKEGKKDDALRSAGRIKKLQKPGVPSNAFLGDKLMDAIYKK